MQKLIFSTISEQTLDQDLQPAPTKPNMMMTLVVPILIVLAIGACIGLGGYGIKQLIAPPVSSTTTTSTTTNAPMNVSVSMPNGVGGTQGLNFTPFNANLTKGGEIVWTNNDSLNHTVTSTTIPSGAQPFNSGNMAPGAVFKWVFTMDGTYHYICSYHYWMTGTVTVTG